MGMYEIYKELNREVKHINVKKYGTADGYEAIFDDSNPNWYPNSEMREIFLKTEELYANNLLKARGYLFLNEVYDLLGLPKTRDGQIVGWLCQKEDVNEYITITKTYIDDKTILLHFNVDGEILDLFTKD